jgi:hypothetical protein
MAKKMRTIGKAVHVRSAEKWDTLGIEPDDTGTRKLADALAEGVAGDRRAYIWIEKKDSTVHVQLLD